MADIKNIVLTGGPCAGKTTALARIIQHFTYRGYAVYAQPEAATLFSPAGVNFLTSDKSLFFESEKQLLSFQLHTEECFRKMAEKTNKPAIIVYDRGMMDVSAYMGADMWQALLDDMGLNDVDVRDKRYDAVLHLCTAAKGATEFYTCDNNSSRTTTRLSRHGWDIPTCVSFPTEERSRTSSTPSYRKSPPCSAYPNR